MKIKMMVVVVSVLLVVIAASVPLTSALIPSAEGGASTKQVAEKKTGDNADCGKGKGDKGNPGGEKGQPAGQGAGPSPRPTGSASNQAPAASTSQDSNVAYSVNISGGFETDPQDHGRPVVLIAAALGVPTEVFRKAFSGVTPAGADRGPTTEEAQSNKAALLKVLSPYGITNDRLDEVSNYYRYNGSKGEVWSRKQATATAQVTNGVVTGIKITNAGAGYSSTPTITITTPSGKITATATVTYTKDFSTNGSITAIKLK
jgi:hypothetical protein